MVEKSMNIENLRREIDLCDRELIKLIERRMKIANEIGKYKAELGLSVFDAKREKERKECWCNSTAEYKKETEIILNILLTLSKCNQISCEKEKDIKAVIAKNQQELLNILTAAKYFNAEISSVCKKDGIFEITVQNSNSLFTNYIVNINSFTEEKK